MIIRCLSYTHTHTLTPLLSSLASIHTTTVIQRTARPHRGKHVHLTAVRRGSASEHTRTHTVHIISPRSRGAALAQRNAFYRIRATSSRALCMCVRGASVGRNSGECDDAVSDAAAERCGCMYAYTSVREHFAAKCNSPMGIRECAW